MKSENHTARVTIFPGKNADGWWDADQLVEQTASKAIPAFEESFGSHAQAKFLFDHSANHAAMAKDALVASKMNLGPGGKQPKMRDGWYFENGVRVPQKMVFASHHGELPGEAKGAKVVLQERGLWRDGLRHVCTECCAVGSCWPQARSAPRGGLRKPRRQAQGPQKVKFWGPWPRRQFPVKMKFWQFFCCFRMSSTPLIFEIQTNPLHSWFRWGWKRKEITPFCSLIKI